jgi:hypothetical protein
MFAVALLALATPIDAEAAALARDLGTTAYEERVELTAGCPAIVLLTPDRGRAVSFLATLRARGHTAAAVDASAVTSQRDMTFLRAFRLGPAALTATEDPAVELPYADLLALVRANHQSVVSTQTTTTEKQFSMGRALLSGGLVNRKAVTKDVKTITEEREHVLYLFRKSGAPPWILRASQGRYAGLGPTAAHSSITNFLATAARLRELAPGAAYDERLLRRRIPERLRVVGAAAKTQSSASDAGVDLYAHLHALAVAGLGSAFAAPLVAE